MRLSLTWSRFRSCLPFLLAFFLSSFPCIASGETIRINGSGSCLEMMKPLIESYLKANPGVTIVMGKPLGSDAAKKALLAGFLDIAVSSREASPAEIEKGVVSRPFGKTPLAVATCKGSGLTNISVEDLEKIYSGKLSAWPSGEKIRPVLRPLSDIDTEILRSLSPGMDRAITLAHRRPGMILAITDTESNSIVSKTAGGIGTAGLTGVINGDYRLHVIALNGVTPSPRTLADGSYPLSKKIIFMSKPGTSRAVSKFLDFIFSKKGRDIATRSGALVTADDKAGK